MPLTKDRGMPDVIALSIVDYTAQEGRLFNVLNANGGAWITM